MKVFTVFTLLLATMSKADDVCSDSCDASTDLCVGEDVSSILSGSEYPICSPSDVGSFSMPTPLFSSTDGPGYIVVIANHYVGCNAGRREANVFSYTSTMIAANHPNVIFLSSLKDSNSLQCVSWSNEYASSWQTWVDDDEAFTTIQPMYTKDSDYVLRDAFFTPPFPHPSYAIVGANGELLSKFVGPCCGYANCKQKE